MKLFRMKRGRIKLGYNEAKTHGISYQMFRALLIVLVCLNTTQARKRLPKRDQVCLNTIRHLQEQMEQCHGMYFCGYFMGYGAHCIPNNQVCDGHSQCEGGEDEAYCPPKSPKCKWNEVLCPDQKTCALLCNKIPECKPAIDELNCVSDIKCQAGQVQCSDGKCAVVGDGNKECDDGSDEDFPEQCEAGEVLCKHKTSRKLECVSTCDGKTDCARDEDAKALSNCPLDCPPASIKCELLNGDGHGCAAVCDKIRQCRFFDESLGPFESSPGFTTFPGATDVCDVLAQSCKLAEAGPMFCFIEPGTTDRPCCGCEAPGDSPLVGIEGLSVTGTFCKQNA